MFNVIRIPTKFSRSIKRFSQKEKSELLDNLINIGEGKTITVPDTIVGDTISLIYGEWMNMESKNGKKPNICLIKDNTELLTVPCPGNPGVRVEESRVEESRGEKKKNTLSLNLGTLANVKLTQEQLDKLYLDYSKQLVNNKIEEISLYIPNAKTKYKDFNAVIRNWLRREGEVVNVNDSVLKMNYESMLDNARGYITRDKWITEMRKYKEKMKPQQIKDIQKIDIILSAENSKKRQEQFYNQ